MALAGWSGECPLQCANVVDDRPAVVRAKLGSVARHHVLPHGFNVEEAPEGVAASLGREQAGRSGESLADHRTIAGPVAAVAHYAVSLEVRLAALEHGELTVAPIVEPLFSKSPGKYRLLAWAPDVLPPLVDVLGITTDRAIAKRPDFLKNMLLARQKAVQLMTDNPAEAAKHVAGPYKMTEEVAEKIIRQLQRPTGPDQVRYWSEGAIYLPSMKKSPTPSGCACFTSCSAPSHIPRARPRISG